MIEFDNCLFEHSVPMSVVGNPCYIMALVKTFFGCWKSEMDVEFWNFFGLKVFEIRSLFLPYDQRTLYLG